MNLADSELYETAEKVVAAFLLYVDQPMTGCEWKRDMCYFKFKRTPGLVSAMEIFNGGRALVEPRAFNRCFAKVNRELHSVRDLYVEPTS